MLSQIPTNQKQHTTHFNSKSKDSLHLHKKGRRSIEEYRTSSQRKSHQLKNSTFNMQSPRLKPLIQCGDLNKQLEQKWANYFNSIRSGSLESRSLQLKISKNIVKENEKIKCFRQKLTKFAKKTQVVNSKQNKNELNKVNYKSALSSPYLNKQKQRQRAIKQFTKSITQIQYQNKTKKQTEQQGINSKMSASKTGHIKNVMTKIDNFILFGEQPKWKQFQSWRRLRYKITIKGYKSNKQNNKLYH